MKTIITTSSMPCVYVMSEESVMAIVLSDINNQMIFLVPKIITENRTKYRATITNRSPDELLRRTELLPITIDIRDDFTPREIIDFPIPVNNINRHTKRHNTMPFWCKMHTDWQKLNARKK